MRKLLWTTAAVLGTAGCLLQVAPVSGQTQGPGSNGAVLKSPFANGGFATERQEVKPGEKRAPHIERLLQQQASGMAGVASQGSPGRRQHGSVGLKLPEEGPDPNQDIAVKPNRGPWMILVTSYVGEDAAKKSREMVAELRKNYRLDAVTFNHGREKRLKEYARVKAVFDKQRRFFEKKGLPVPTTLRAKYHRYQEQYAVLVGDCKTPTQARAELKRVRSLKPPDPKRVGHLLFTMFYQKKDDEKKPVRAERVFVNPFTHAFIVRNPAAPKQQKQSGQQLDLSDLRQLNRGEPYSLLKCDKKLTLVVKQFFTPAALQQRSAKGSFLDHLGLGKTGANLDNAAQNAHNLAKLFRERANLDAYVLHTKFSSIVTVGAFNSLQDPRIESTKHLLTTRLHVPRAMPMKVPGRK